LSYAGGSGNQALLFALADGALRSVPKDEPYWSLQRRHPADEHRWFDLAHYPSKRKAEAALARVVEFDHADGHELRVEHIRRTPAR
jgi:hypothetical protein